jgi:hypothetical protein
MHKIIKVVTLGFYESLHRPLTVFFFADSDCTAQKRCHVSTTQTYLLILNSDMMAKHYQDEKKSMHTFCWEMCFPQLQVNVSVLLFCKKKKNRDAFQ